MAHPHHSDEDLPEIAKNPRTSPAVQAVMAISVGAQDLQMRIFGQMSIEREPSDQSVVYCCYPSGDFYTWFIEVGLAHFVLVALVDEKMKCLGLVPVSEHEQFLQLVNDIGNGLNIKNHYPVEDPDSFKAANTGRNSSDENPPDKTNRG